MEKWLGAACRPARARLPGKLVSGLTSCTFVQLFQQKEKVAMFPVDSLLIHFLNMSLIRVVLSSWLSFPFLLSLRLEVHLFTSEFLVTLSQNASFWQDPNPPAIWLDPLGKISFTSTFLFITLSISGLDEGASPLVSVAP